MIHRLKIKQEYADAIKAGAKRFEVRKNDRNYTIGDILVFSVPEETKTEKRRYEPIEASAYCITYILTAEDFADGIKSEYCVLAIAPMEDDLSYYYQQITARCEEECTEVHDGEV